MRFSIPNAIWTKPQTEMEILFIYLLLVSFFHRKFLFCFSFNYKNKRKFHFAYYLLLLKFIICVMRIILHIYCFRWAPIFDKIFYFTIWSMSLLEIDKIRIVSLFCRLFLLRIGVILLYFFGNVHQHQLPFFSIRFHALAFVFFFLTQKKRIFHSYNNNFQIYFTFSWLQSSRMMTMMCSLKNPF